MHLVEMGGCQVLRLRPGLFIWVDEDATWEEVREIEWVHATARIVLGRSPNERVIIRQAWATCMVAEEVMD